MAVANRAQTGRIWRASQSLTILASMLLVAPAWAVRSNLRSDLPKLEQMGHYEEALFYRRSTIDMIMAIHVAWSGAPYDPAMDGLYHETRVDRRYWNLIYNQRDGKLWAYDTSRLSFTMDARILSSPALWRGKLYIGTMACFACIGGSE
jgi:hypothetical protein